MIHEPVFTSWHVTRCHDMRLRYHRSHVTLHMCHGGLQSWELMMIVNPNMTQLLRLGPRSEHSESKPVLWDVRDQIECHLKPERGEICGIMTGITQTPDRMNEWKESTTWSYHCCLNLIDKGWKISSRIDRIDWGADCAVLVSICFCDKRTTLSETRSSQIPHWLAIRSIPSGQFLLANKNISFNNSIHSIKMLRKKL